jgi:hypothetical protein
MERDELRAIQAPLKERYNAVGRCRQAQLTIPYWGARSS